MGCNFAVLKNVLVVWCGWKDTIDIENHLSQPSPSYIPLPHPSVATISPLPSFVPLPESPISPARRPRRHTCLSVLRIFLPFFHRVGVRGEGGRYGQSVMAAVKTRRVRGTLRTSIHRFPGLSIYLSRSLTPQDPQGLKITESSPSIGSEVDRHASTNHNNEQSY